MFFYRLNPKQLDKLSDIFADLGLVGIASVILPAFFDNKLDLSILFIGFLGTFILWYISIWIRR
ncbi:MAG: hypothetical protein AAB521_03770 [Patescibacteria group bacterium]